jgi:hypothetical protein
MGMGSPERNANREDTQVENLCYGGRPGSATLRSNWRMHRMGVR